MSESMWAYQLDGPGRFVRVETPRPMPERLGPGDVLLEVLAGGVCGSDLPIFRGQLASHGDLGGIRAARHPGHPMHEVVGRVVASRHPQIREADQVVGWAAGWDGIAEYCVTTGEGLATYDPALDPVTAVAIQPLACVLSAVERMTDIAGARAAVIGLGPIGLLFTHVLKARGAAHVIGVDRVDRTSMAEDYGIDEVVHATSDRWATQLPEADRPSHVVEAVGHQTGTLRHAVQAAAFGGQLFYFGIADEPVYPFDMMPFLRKGLTLRAGVARDRRRVLAEAGEYLVQHPDLASTYVTGVFAVDRVQEAFDCACVARPGQAKIVLSMR